MFSWYLLYTPRQVPVPYTTVSSAGQLSTVIIDQQIDAAAVLLLLLLSE
jgi:hypothetical protein